LFISVYLEEYSTSVLVKNLGWVGLRSLVDCGGSRLHDDPYQQCGGIEWLVHLIGIECTRHNCLLVVRWVLFLIHNYFALAIGHERSLLIWKMLVYRWDCAWSLQRRVSYNHWWWFILLLIK